MSVRQAWLPLPRWIPSVVGVALTSGISLLAIGAIGLPRWLDIGPEHGAEIRVQRAEALMRAATLDIARAKALAAGRRGETNAGTEGLIGSELTPLVTTLGALEAKRVSTSPAWARAVATELRAAGVRPGDIVAASFSGSFPGLNIAVMSACQALDARLIAVSSVTASSWGANEPGFTWPEMEVRLVRDGVLNPASVAVSPGGSDDRALDLEPEGQRLAHGIAARAARDLGARLLEPASFEESVSLRLAVFDEYRKGRSLAAFVNVGGATASLGESPAILRLRSGWIPPVPFDSSPHRGLVARMAERGVPVLHLLNIQDLALRWGIY
jgi:poly-gamma-glutamate system protein